MAILRAAIISCLVVSGCESVPVQPGHVAAAFVEALNAKNVEPMTELASTPFRYRNQLWESAPDGSGYVLGMAEDRVANSADELRALLENISSAVQVEDPAPVANPPSKTDLLSGPLKGAPSQWSEINPVLFRRGEEDVEHIAIIGVDAKGKVSALYVN